MRFFLLQSPAKCSKPVPQPWLVAIVSASSCCQLASFLLLELLHHGCLCLTYSLGAQEVVLPLMGAVFSLYDSLLDCRAGADECPA